jgi:hypothetical protein
MRNLSRKSTSNLQHGKYQGLIRGSLNCELVHDAIDYCCVEDEIESGESEFVLMTTWHDNEPLEEAFSFFRNLAIPCESELFNNFE